MDALKHLIAYFLRIAVFFFLFAFVWWVISLFFPMLNFRTLIPTFSGKTATSTTEKKDWLPSPRLYKGLLGTAATPNAQTNLYVAPKPFAGFNTTSGGSYEYVPGVYITYSQSGASAEEDNVVVPSQATSTPRAIYVRNLSLYQGETVGTGFSFIGEARNGMFKNGKFPVILLDNNRKAIGISAAVATTDWTVPGWVRFKTKIEYPVPKGVQCVLLFEEDRLDSEANRVPVRVGVPVRCN